MTSSRIRTSRRAALDRQRVFGGATVTLLLVVLCFLVIDCQIVIPPQGWSQRWGPLVPHSTFPGDCGLCHLPERWDVIKKDFAFDHEKETGHALSGAHAGAACLRCHNDRGPVHVYVARGCGGCHADPHESNLGLECTRCHDENTWRPGGLIAEHARTRFPLFGAHVAAPCESCHPSAAVGDFRGAPTDCDLCHQAELQATSSPDHVASGWLRSCERCHTPSGWGRANFAHGFFPLNGGHGGLDCSQCHTGGAYTGLSSDCISCHQDDYQGAPNHVAAGYSTDCLQCHRRNSWTGARFDHDFFPLAGGHGGLNCVQCHTSGTVGPIPSDCYSCHQDEYTGAPGHVGSFPTTCENCHGTTTWEGATVDHSQFPLTGGHSGIACERCHTSGTFGTIPSTCVSCHQDDYAGAPDHAAQSFSLTCEDCHTTANWSSTFNHAFPLRGEHDEPCGRCHEGNVATFTCIVCHKHRQSAMDDKHREERGYSYNSQACYDCHPNGKH